MLPDTSVLVRRYAQMPDHPAGPGLGDRTEVRPEIRQVTASKRQGEAHRSHRDDAIEERELAGCPLSKTWLDPRSKDVH